MSLKLDAIRIAKRSAQKRHELLTEIAPMVGLAVAGIGIASPSCLPGVALYAGVLVGMLYAGLHVSGWMAARRVFSAQAAT